MTSNQPAKTILHSIQALRFAAALAVVLYHANFAANKYLPDGAIGFVDNILELGPAGVHVFFVISGFIMVQTTQGRSGPSAALDFWLRRFTRIYPIYWVAALVYLAVHALFLEIYVLTPGETIMAFLLVPGWASHIIGPAWTLWFEVYFYAAFGLSLLLQPRLALPILSVIFVLLACTGVFWPTGPGPFTHPLILEFIAGAWIARILMVYDKSPRYLGWILLGLSCMAFGVSSLDGLQSLSKIVLWGPASVALVASVVMLEQQYRDGAALRALSALGESSYALYLIHILVIDIVIALIVHFSVEELPRELTIIMCTVASIVTAIAFHSIVELPILRLLRRKLSAVPQDDNKYLGGAA